MHEDERLSAVVADFVFFFQAEDGIRGIGVTGVQTCALPISCRRRTAAAVAAGAAGQGTTRGRSDRSPRGGQMGKPVLLAVDDDGPVLSAIERDLRERYGEHYQIYAASSGEQALDLMRRLRLREDPVALLLVDQRMPGMSGVELLTASRKVYPDARRVLLTAYADTDAPIKAINDAYVQHYLLKPWDPPEDRLYPVLDDLLQTWRPPPPLANLRLISDRWSRSGHALREFLARNLVPYRWLDVESDPEARQLLDVAAIDAGSLPALVLDDGDVLVQPDLQEVGARIGLRAQAQRAAYDLVVVGAGPAGLAAAVYGASEGLSTLVLECNAPGGQAGTTSRIENYLGFPVGLSGADLTLRAREQAVRFGAEILVPAEVVGVRREGPYTVVRPAHGGEVSASTLIIATGVEYRTLDVPGDRKSTRLNSSHANISYAVFCLKKKKNNNIVTVRALPHQ